MKKTKRSSRFSKLSLLVLSLVFALTACGGNKTEEKKEAKEEKTEEKKEETKETKTEETAKKDDDTFTYVIGGDPGKFVNPITTGDRWGHTMQKQIFSPLYIIHPDGIRYFLAEDVSVLEGEEKEGLRVKLKEGVKWNDGEDFTADDVVFTFECLTNPETGSTSAARLTFDGTPMEAVKIDDHTVELYTPYFSAATMDLVSRLFMIPEHIYHDTIDFENSPLHANPVGTGPYMLKEHKAGEYVHLVANPEYFDGPAQIENVILQIVENANSAKLALQKGEVDAITALPSDLEDFAGNDDLTVHSYSEGRVGYLMMNTTPEIMKNEDFRKAIFYSLDRNEMNIAAYLAPEYFENADTFLPPDNPFYYDGANKYERDIEKAKEHLEASGITDSIVLAHNATDPVQNVQAILIQQYLQETGINCEIKAVDGSALTNLMRDTEEEGHHIVLGGYIMGNDPSRYQSLFISGSTSNYSHYEDPVIDELFQKGVLETDEAARKEIYNELQVYMLDKAIQFPIVDNYRLLVSRSDLAGIDEAKLVSIFTFDDMSKLYYK